MLRVLIGAIIRYERVLLKKALQPIIIGYLLNKRIIGSV